MNKIDQLAERGKEKIDRLAELKELSDSREKHDKYIQGSTKWNDTRYCEEHRYHG